MTDKNNNPIDVAKQLSDLKKEHGTNGKVAQIMEMSEAKVSRYIALLDLPKEIQQQVEVGELPVTNPIKALNKRSKAKKPTVSVLNESQRQIINVLARTVFATQTQIARYMDKSLNAARVVINDLVDSRFLEAQKELRPFVYRLSSHGATITGSTKPRHWMSANAIHQRALRNEIELGMLERNPSAIFVERAECWNLGLFPSVGEHLLRFENKGEQQKALVIIDDYLMDSKRIARSLSRLHDKDKSYASGDLVLTWKDVADIVLIYTTDKEHQKAHQSFIQNHLSDFEKPIVVRHIAPIWEVI